MGKMMQDIRYAVRQLRKTPGFTITAVLTLALGIGANAAIFTLVNAVLLKNLPVADPKTLVRIGDEDQCCVGAGARADFSIFSSDQYAQLKKDPEFASLTAMQAGFPYMPLTARRGSGNEAARSAVVEFVAGNYFQTFGVQSFEGRTLNDSDDATGAPATAVMSYEQWVSQYHSDPSVVGSTFWINTKPATVVGIAPRGFFGDRLEANPPQYYMPLAAMPEITGTEYAKEPELGWLWLIGRTQPGVDTVALQNKLSAQLRQMFAGGKTFASAHDKPVLDKVHVVVTPAGAGIEEQHRGYRGNLNLLMWIAGFVLLIACANIANLLVVRGLARKSEMAVRAALGAARHRIVRQLLTESLLLAAISGTAALVVSYGGSRLLLMMQFPGQQHVPISTAPSLMVLLFAVGVSTVTGILFGIAPAVMAAQSQPADALRSGTRSVQGGATLLQRGLVVLQATLSLVLLVGAAMFSQSLSKLQHIDLHLNATNRYIVHFNPQAAGYSGLQMEPLYRTIEERFHQIPGVVNVGISTYTPMEDNNWGNNVQVQGQPDQRVNASYVKATPEYFDSVGTRVVMGRGIGVQDTMNGVPVGVVNQAFVKKFFKNGENPLGHRFGAPNPIGSTGSDSTGNYEIVGVVEDTAYSAAGWKDHVMFFRPMTQRNPQEKRSVEKDTELYAGAIVIQTSRPIDNMEQLATSTLSSINPNLAIIKYQTFQQQIDDMFNSDRMLSQLMGMFGGLALLLAAVGLYGVTAYGVARRTSEIGIRMALGAERVNVVGMVMRGALAQTLLGLAIGVPIAYYCMRFVKSQLYDMDTVNTSAVLTAVFTLIAAACIAGLLPARKAASVDPASALRSE